MQKSFRKVIDLGKKYRIEADDLNVTLFLELHVITAREP